MLHLVLVQTSDQCLDTGSVLHQVCGGNMMTVTAPVVSLLTLMSHLWHLLIRVLSHHRDCDNCTTSMTTLHLAVRALT